MIYSIISRMAHLPMFSRITRMIYGSLSGLVRKDLDLCVNEASERVYAVYKKPKGTIRWKRSNNEVKCDLSVIIPFYNTEKYARKCIESVLSQESKYAFEVILVNDGSPDNCGKILDSYNGRENIVVIHQENAGVSVARNTGLRIATGEYVMFVDSDDILLPGAIENLMKNAEKHSADIVEGGYYTFSDKGKKKTYSHCFRIGTQGEGMFGYPCGKVFRSSLFDSICFPAEYWYEDTIISSHIHRAAGVSVVIPELVFGYYVNDAGLTAQTRQSIKCIDTLSIIELIMNDIGREEMGSSYKHAFIYQLCVYLFHRTKYLSKELHKAVFILAADLAEKYELCDVEPTSFYENELICALKYRQYYRWKWASILI